MKHKIDQGRSFNGRRRGLPDLEVIEALQGYNLLRTNQNGWIEVDTDGAQMWVEVEKTLGK